MTAVSGIAGGPIAFLSSLLSGEADVTIVVEDGTGKATANSFVTIAEFQAYFENQPRDVSTYTDDNIEAKLVAAAYILTWRYRWCGKRTYSAQALSWPRIGGKDRDWQTVQRTEIPLFLKIAQYELAYWLLVNTTKTGFESEQDQADQLYDEIEIFEGIRVEYRNTGKFKPLPTIISEIVAPCGSLAGGLGTFFIERS